MNILKSKFIFYLMFLILFLSLPANNINSETPNNNADVCIIYAKSNYKLILIEAIEKRLSNKSISIVKDQLKNINNYDPADYKVVVILSGIAVFTPYPQATKYIRKHDYAKNIIYFCASSTKSAVYGFLDGDRIDAITAASEEENIENTTNEIVTKIFEIIGNSI